MLVGITVALAALAVLGAIVIVAVGGGGELSTEHPDHPPLALPARRPVAGTDAALLHLPLGLWGYHKQITDEALERFAYELTERDTRIAVLEQELAEARQRHPGQREGQRQGQRQGEHQGQYQGDQQGRYQGQHRSARPALPPGDGSFAGGDPLATRADLAFGAPVEGGDPLATRTDRPSPVTREDALLAAVPEAEPNAEAKAEAELEPKAEPEPKPEPKPETDAKPETKTEAEAGDKTKAEPGDEAEAERRDDAGEPGGEDPRPAREDGAG